MPLTKKDIDFNWLTQTFGDSWTDWRNIGSEWQQHEKPHNSAKLTALQVFFESCLLDNRFSPLLDHFFTQEPILHPNLVECFDKSYTDQEIVLYHNLIIDFLDWVITAYYSVEDDKGNLHPQVANPIQAIYLE